MNGRPDQAELTLQEAWKVAESAGRCYLRALLRDTEAKIAAIRGQFEEAQRLLGSAQELYRDCGLLISPFTSLRQRLERALAEPRTLVHDGPPW